MVVCTYTNIYAIHIYISISIYIYLYIYIYMYIYIYIYIYISFTIIIYLKIESFIQLKIHNVSMPVVHLIHVTTEMIKSLQYIYNKGLISY